MNERSIFEITGTDREHFLQGLVSNDVRRLADGPVYAALLTPQGKYLADFLLVPLGEKILLDIAAPIAEATVRRLSMYKLRADVQISPSDLQVQRGTGPAPEGAVADPRHPALGWRLYGAEAGDDGSDWDAIRVAHCIPETGIELTPETYILEAGFERLHGVDFRKGCYVGQEVTARMKHKTDLRKGLVTVAITGTAPVGTEITAEGRAVGTLFTQSGGQAIAHLRLDRATGPMQAGAAQVTLP
ncbi:folate-binding protein [Paenirhodobacter sp. CAU 1674]|uniref:CAF17-like 4Fe-4S cluster assembly/insertion protein YgfZ n=1 Tax=Paenirhodobacter sp. CAU 1674 TaxID=3032596 RepID=UPI0023DA31F2|nr:folate-binding protein [Paenirhodobacter sp. CAU 1674]MDF2140795.1 folate-binding protein [Paenirhodobacter sp. CAU 1674]